MRGDATLRDERFELPFELYLVAFYATALLLRICGHRWRRVDRAARVAAYDNRPSLDCASWDR